MRRTFRTRHHAHRKGGKPFSGKQPGLPGEIRTSELGKRASGGEWGLLLYAPLSEWQAPAHMPELDEGGEHTQAFDDAGHMLQNIGDIGVAGIAAQTEPDGAVCGRERDAHGSDDV